MQPPHASSLPLVPALIQRDFHSEGAVALWRAIEPRGYPRNLQPWTLAAVMVGAFLGRMSGLRRIIEVFGRRLCVSSISTLSKALSNGRFADFLAAAVARLEGSESWEGLGAGDLVAVDTTWLSLPATQRSKGLRKIASDAVGIGAMYALRLDGGRFPLRLLGILHGAANDTKPVRRARLLACGPTYVMDRGFYSMKTVDHWVSSGVRFVVRAKAHCLKYRVEQVLSAPRRADRLSIEEDAVVLLGSEKTRLARARVRLVRARRRSDGEQIILVSGNMDWSAEQLLDAYKRRWEIEDFFLFLKEQLGMAHLYGFSANAMESLLRLAMLGIGMLLHEEAGANSGKTVAARLRAALREARRLLGVPTPWRPNTTRKWQKKKRPRKPAETAPQTPRLAA